MPRSGHRERGARWDSLIPRRLGYGYVTNKMGMDLQSDPRDLALRRALTSVLAHL